VALVVLPVSLVMLVERDLLVCFTVLCLFSVILCIYTDQKRNLLAFYAFTYCINFDHITMLMLFYVQDMMLYINLLICRYYILDNV